MLDIVFSMSVLGAVLFFGALISAGNERQRKAIDGIREQAARWAERDLQLKRERAARDVRVDDPAGWLESIATSLAGVQLDVLSLAPWRQEDARAIIGLCADGRKLVATPMIPSRFLKAVQAGGKSRIARAEVGVLGDSPKRVPVHELSIVTAGVFFDLEAAQVWLKILGEPLTADRLYLFEVPAQKRRS